MESLSLLGYFDPGAGSLLLQALVGGAAGLMVFARFLWDSWLRPTIKRRAPR